MTAPKPKSCDDLFDAIKRQLDRLVKSIAKAPPEHWARAAAALTSAARATAMIRRWERADDLDDDDIAAMSDADLAAEIAKLSAGKTNPPFRGGSGAK